MRKVRLRTTYPVLDEHGTMVVELDNTERIVGATFREAEHFSYTHPGGGGGGGNYRPPGWVLLVSDEEKESA